MSDHGGDNTGSSGFTAAGRALKYLAWAFAVAGLLVAAAGALRYGALVFSSAVTLFGAGRLLSADDDRTVSFVLFVAGIFSVLGVLGHLLTGL